MVETEDNLGQDYMDHGKPGTAAKNLTKPDETKRKQLLFKALPEESKKMVLSVVRKILEGNYKDNGKPVAAAEQFFKSELTGEDKVMYEALSKDGKKVLGKVMYEALSKDGKKVLGIAQQIAPVVLPMIGQLLAGGGGDGGGDYLPE